MQQVWCRSALAAALLFMDSSTSASVVTPAKSLRALAGRPVWVPICSRRGVNGSSPWFDNINTAVMDQVACVSPAYGTVTAVKLVYAAFDMPQQGEVDRPVTAIGTASVYVPGANNFQVFANGSVSAGSTVLNFSSTALGANGISVGQVVSSVGGGIAANTYVAAVANSFAAGSGNAPTGTVVTLSNPTTAATAAGQPMNFSGSFVPAKFGGRRQFTIEPAHDVVTSDPVAVQLSPGNAFFVRSFAAMSGPGLQLMDYPGTTSRLTGEFDSRNTTPADQTMVPATLSNTGGGYWCPVAVLALVNLPAGQPVPGAVLILGDSIAAGTGDNADALGLQGYIQRSLEGNIGFIAAARGSSTAVSVSVHGDGQYALSVDAGITDVLLEDGRNDLLSFNVTDVQLESTILQVAARYVSAGKRVWCFSVPPTTQSNDGWATLANQSWTVAVANTGASTTGAGATLVTMASVSNIVVGQAVSGAGVAAGTVVNALAGSVLTLSVPLAAALPGTTKLSFGSGSAAAAPAETYRLSYNTYLRQHAAALGCAGLIDDDRVFADPAGSGKWRVDLGPASVDGVHPAAALHQAAVNAGLITPAMFLPP
jgi:hypothetical protein